MPPACRSSAVVANAKPPPARPGCCATLPRSEVYRRRRPERTLPYRTVQGWLETWIACREEAETHSVAGYVERELRAYLECGVLAHGFARARCGDCAADFLVAFSCKGRGVCPSCTTKRMAATAAHLVDAVIPRVPMRQWVLALPKRLRPALRADPVLATCVLRVFLSAIERALRAACRDAPVGSRLGAFGRFATTPAARAAPSLRRCAARSVSFVQRFGSALNEHWHYHCCVSDGLFAETGAGLEFLPAAVDGAMAGRVAEPHRLGLDLSPAEN